MADIDDEDQQLLPMNEVHDAVAPYPIGVPTFQFAFERLSLIRLTLKIIEGTGDPLIECWLPLGHAADDALGLVGEFNLIGGQERF